MKLLALRTFLFVTLGLGLLLTSCKNDFSLNGEYRITPVVFGLLDQNDSIHKIKITKAFLGDDNNFLYAEIPDSSYFESVDAQVIEYLDGSATGRSWDLYPILIDNKDTSGVFYAPTQKVYAFQANDLNPKAEYELIADINEGEHSIRAITSLIDGFSVTNVNTATGISFNNANPTEEKDYKSWTFSVIEAFNAADYNYKYIIHWTEYYLDGSSQSFELERNNGNKPQEKPDQPASQTGSFGGLDFFQFIESQIPDDPQVEYRQLDGIDLKVSVAHDELAQYIAVSQPLSGIAQSSPEYTNIEGGLGLFSSRYLFRVNGFKLSTNSMRELCRGPYTTTKKFCSQYPEHTLESWGCN